MLFVLIGPTRSGKSTFINSILGENVAKEGIKGEIESTTTKISNYVQI
jgi:GTPase Era involved in 16S rRNA processing